MSEYQVLHFLAVDRPLDDKQLAYMEKQSSHAEVTSREFSVEYHHSDFRGDVIEMMRRGYDVHLHFANFGIRKLMFRLPELPCDTKTFEAYEVGYGLEWKSDKRGRAGILSIEPEAEGDTYDYLEDAHSMLSRLVPLREMMLQRDLRPLYLAWLANNYDEDAVEPPVPAGLGQLDGALEAMAEFYELPTDLLEAAAEQALPEPEKFDCDAAANQWIGKLKKAELHKIVSDLAAGDAATVQADLICSIRQSSPVDPAPTTHSGRTLGELREIAASMQNKRAERETIAREKARKKQLKSIAADPNKLIRRIDTLVLGRSRENYRQVANCLTDLAEALGEGPGPAKARQIAQRLRGRKPRSNILISVLREHGWID